MSGKRSRNKGANGEREFARLVQSYGFDCERTGRNGRTAEDVTHSVPGWHFEVKRRETLCVPEWVRQAHADAGELVPAVAFRRNRTTPADPLGQWHAIQPCADLFRLLAEVRDMRAEVEAVRDEIRGRPPADPTPVFCSCGRDLHGYRGPLCRYCDGTAE